MHLFLSTANFLKALTFGDQCVPVGAGQSAIDLTDQLHVVEEGIEGVEVGEAHHVRRAASCCLKNRGKQSQSFCTGGAILTRLQLMAVLVVAKMLAVVHYAEVVDAAVVFFLALTPHSDVFFFLFLSD